MRYFISYAEIDRKLAKWVGNILQSELGHEMIMPQSDLKHGYNFTELANENLEQADAVVIILTKTYMESKYRQETLTNAKKLLPIKFDNCKPEGLLNSLVYLDLSGLEKNTAKETLISALKGVQRPSEQPSLPKSVGIIRARKKEVNIQVFTETEAITFLKKSIRAINDDEAVNLAQKLDYLPLALGYAVAYINECNLSCSNYISLLEKYGLELQNKSYENSDYNKTLTASLQISIEQINDETTRQLLNLCAYCAPDNIPLSMFVDGREELPSPLKETLAPENALKHNELIKSLTKFGFLSLQRVDGETFLSMHSLTQQVLFNMLLDDTWIYYSLNMVYNIFRYEYGNLLSMNKFVQNLPHVMQIARHGNMKLSEDIKAQKKVASLYFEAGIGSDLEGNYPQALEWYYKALVIYGEKPLVQDQFDIATTYSNIAGVYDNLGEYDKALEYYGIALRISEKIIGQDHPSTAITYNNIAGVYKNLGEYDKALEYYDKALRISEKILGQSHPDTATTYNNIAMVYYNLCEFSRALEWINKALSIREKALGQDHPDTATTYNNIALIYENLSEYHKALEYYDKALQISETVLGQDHPDTATTYNNVAGVYDHLDEYDKALEWLNKALIIREKTLGQNHPFTAFTYNSIAGVYGNLGEYDKALEWFNKALAIREKTLGQNHPSTAVTYNSIAGVYGNLGEYDKALEWYLKSYNIRIKIFGTTHPYTIATLKNMKFAYEKTSLPQPLEKWLLQSEQGGSGI